VPQPATLAHCRALDERFAMTARDNYEVLVAWLVLALRSGYLAVVPRVEQVLAAVGRMKYLRPLYAALAADPRTRPTALAVFERLRAGYHPIACQVVEAVLRG
jgi:leukotriene-A4 hydrolase